MVVSPYFSSYSLYQLSYGSQSGLLLRSLHMFQLMSVLSCKSYISLSSTMSKCGLSSIQTIQY